MQGSNADTLAWARRAKPTCDPAPSTAPSGQQLATFAGMVTSPCAHGVRAKALALVATRLAAERL